jgi:hypothetical protein
MRAALLIAARFFPVQRRAMILLFNLTHLPNKGCEYIIEKYEMTKRWRN